MREIIMEKTIPLICKTQEDFMKLNQEGFVYKEKGESRYLIKENQK